MKKIGLALVVFGLGCASKPVVEETGAVLSTWEGTVLVTDKTQAKNHKVSMGLLVENKTRLRLDVTGPLSTPLAAAVVQKSRLTAVLPKQKKYFDGPATAAALQSVFKISMDPRVLFHLVNDESLPKPEWSCVVTSEGRPSSCRNQALELAMNWEYASDNQKTVKIESPRYSLAMDLERVPTKVQNADKAFSLRIPEGYKNETY